MDTRKPMIKRVTKIVFLTALGASLLSLPAMSAGIQAKLQAAIFAKILGYDQSLAQKSGTRLEFHIVLDTATTGSKAETMAGFASINNAPVAGKAIGISSTTPAQMSTGLGNGNAHVLYLPDGTLPATLNAALSLGRSQKIPVLCGNEAMVQSGCAVGITAENGKPRILVNMAQSKAQGMVLSSQLLQLARIIK